MKKALYIFFTAVLMVLFFASASFAGTWTIDKNGWKWIQDDGTAAAGCWMWCDGNNDGRSECYYFTPEGYCLLNCTTPDGYTVNADGAWVDRGTVQIRYTSVKPSESVGKSARQMAADKANELGRDLKACYDWCAKGGIQYAADYALNDDLGICHYAERGFTLNKGDCYDMACCFALMARELGYSDCSVISGYVPLRGGGISPHCWTEITINGSRVICDPDFEYERKTNGYMINYGQKGTWRYQPGYHEMHD